MNIVFMGKDKPHVIKGLDYLIKKNVTILTVVAKKSNDPNSLFTYAKKRGLTVSSPESIYKYIANLHKPVDLAISYLFWKKIKPDLLNSKLGCINFHPAPLPEFRGVGGYNMAIYEEVRTWGVSAHFVDNSFDTGDIIKVNRFTIVPENETAFSLEKKTQKKLYELYIEVIDTILINKKLPRYPQSKGRYITMKEFNTMRAISQKDTTDIIDKKIRAFWFPPYPGAYIEIKNKKYTLINEYILQDLNKHAK